MYGATRNILRRQQATERVFEPGSTGLEPAALPGYAIAPLKEEICPSVLKVLDLFSIWRIGNSPIAKRIFAILQIKRIVLKLCVQCDERFKRFYH